MVPGVVLPADETGVETGAEGVGGIDEAGVDEAGAEVVEAKETGVGVDETDEDETGVDEAAGVVETVEGTGSHPYFRAS